MTSEKPITKQDIRRSLAPVLVVDDSKAQRRLLTRTLEKWGYETLEAGSGEEALKLCKATAFDIVISDWLMPGMSGVEFCRAFRGLGDRPAFFLLLTAQTEREILAEGLESGADDFLSKPFNAVELRARLRAGRRIVEAQKALSEKNLALSQTLEELSDAYAAIDRDLKGARRFQEALVPERIVDLDRAQISLLFRSSGHVGGDLVGYFPVRDGEMGVFSVDVSGHGVASALMTARIAGFLSATSPERNIALRKVDDGYAIAPLDEVCAQLNALLLADADSDQYLTLSIAWVNLTEGRVRLCQAGHPSPVVQRRSGAIEFSELWSTPVGLVEDAEFTICDLDLFPGDRLILYSDGVTECPDPHDRLLDESGFEILLRENSNLKGEHFMKGILSSLIAFRGGQDFPDDISAVCVEFH